MSHSIVVLLALLAVKLTFPKCYAVPSLSTSTNITASDEDVNIKVIGGSPVALGVAPWVVSLRSLSNVHFCGGTLLNTRYAVTAAHCVAGRAVNGVNVVVGTNQLLTGGSVHRSSNIIIYPDFSAASMVHDISLVFTATAIVMTLTVQPINLDEAIFLDNRQASIFGWGLYSTTLTHTVNVLHSMSANIISNDDCRSNLETHNALLLTDRNVCTGGTIGRGTCFGDEGGPLVGFSEDPFSLPIPSLIGISSWQVPCGTGAPDVYTRIAPYRLWILSNI